MPSPKSLRPSIPIPSVLPGRYEFTWGPEGIILALFRLRERGDSISAQVQLDDTSSGQAEHLYGADRLSLTSGKDRRELAKALTLRRNNVDWTLMLEQASNAVVSHMAQDAPVIDIGQLPLSKAPAWRLEPIMPEGLVSVLTGDGGTGKSTLAIAFGLCIQQGWGQTLGLTALKGEVGYLDYEMDWQRLNDICLDIEAGLELPSHPHLHYLHLSDPITDEAERIQRMVSERNLKALIVDSAAPACGGERELRENASPLMTTLASFGISVLLITHVTKDEEHPSRKPYGSVYVHNLGRHHWFLRAAQEPGDSAWDVALYNTKSNVSKLHSAIGFHIDRSETTTIRSISVGSVPELRQGLTVISQILAVVTRTALSVEQIVQETGLKEPTIRTKLSQGKKRGLFIQTPSGLWGRPISDLGITL